MMAARKLTRSLLFAGVSLVVIYAALHLAGKPIDIATPAVESAPLDLLDPDVVRSVTGPAVVATETLARPVFSPSRRPIASPGVVPAPAPTAAPTGQLTLVGVMIDAESRRALIASPNAPNGEWLSIGATLGDGRLAKIEADFVEIESPAGPTRLQLYVDNTPPL